MSDDSEAPEEPAEEVDEAAEPPDSEPEESDEGAGEADVEASVPDELSAADVDVDPDTDGDGDGDGDAPSHSSAPTAGGWGEMYVGSLEKTTNWMINEYGDEDAEPVDREHFESPIDLEERFNELLESNDVGSDMGPGQAVAVGSAFAVLFPLITRTDVLEELTDGDTEEP